MNNSKELLLWVACTISAVGAQQIQVNIWNGVALLLISCALFIARGFFKKYIEFEKK